MTNLMDIIEISTDSDGSKYHTAESGYKGGNYYEYVVSMKKIAIEDDDNAYDCAVGAGLVAADIDDRSERPLIYVWKLDDPQTCEYYTDDAKAQEAFESMIDLYYECEINELDENLSEGYSDGHPDYSWMTENMDVETRDNFGIGDLKQVAITLLVHRRNLSLAVAEYIWSEYIRRYESSAKITVFRAKGNEYADKQLTARQVEHEYGLKPGTVRSYIRFNPSRVGKDFIKIDGRTWAMTNETAFWIWGKNKG